MKYDARNANKNPEAGESLPQSGAAHIDASQVLTPEQARELGFTVPKDAIAVHVYVGRFEGYEPPVAPLSPEPTLGLDSQDTTISARVPTQPPDTPREALGQQILRALEWIVGRTELNLKNGDLGDLFNVGMRHWLQWAKDVIAEAKGAEHLGDGVQEAGDRYLEKIFDELDSGDAVNSGRDPITKQCQRKWSLANER